jgi:hypothetical protein
VGPGGSIFVSLGQESRHSSDQKRATDSHEIRKFALHGMTGGLMAILGTREAFGITNQLVQLDYFTITTAPL